MTNEELQLETEIEKLREEMQQKSRISDLTAQDILHISEKLDALINIYLLTKMKKNKNNNQEITQTGLASHQK